MKNLLLLSVVAAIIGLSFFWANQSSALPLLESVNVEPRPLLLGVIPYLQPEELRKQILPITQYLSHKLQRKVEFISLSDYQSLGRLLELNRIQIAMFSDTSYRKLKKENNWEVICRPVQYGSVVYRGQIIARKGGGIDKIADLKGKTFAYVDRYSGSGFYYPNLLFDRAGIKPLDYFSSVVFSQSHRSSIQGVIKGDFHAASVFSASLLPGENEASGAFDEVRVIARTDPIPNDPMVVRADLDANLKNAISRAMLAMHEDPKGREFLQPLIRLRGTEKFVSETEVQRIILSESAQ